MEAFRGKMKALLSSSSSSTSPWAVPQLAQVGGRDPAGDREHMFDKVVTPSDVGKLNRLVIPKQHAERFFPLEPPSADKGLVLSFEDRCGKQWSFRYSYWNSSQSYVITKGWSRFVKEKRLDAGDTVSFSRARGDEVGGRQLPGRLFIDLHHRSKLHRAPPPPLPPPRPLQPLQPISFAQARHPLLLTAPWLYYRPGLGFPSPRSGADTGEGEVVLESVPVVFAGVAKTKRVRLFGVNLDCPDPGEGSGGGGGGQLLLPALTRPLPTWQRRAGAEAAVADVTEKKIVQSSMYIHFGGEKESQEIKENMTRFDLI